MGRARRRRAVLLQLRSGGSVSCARRAHSARSLSGCRHGDHGFHHLVRLQPGHRAVPQRRRRLQGRFTADRAARRPRRGLRPHRGLRAHRRDFGGERRGRAVQPVARGMARLESAVRHGNDRPATHAQPARHERSHQGAAADLHRLRRGARLPDRLRHLCPLRASGAARPGNAGGDVRHGPRPRLAVRGGHTAVRLLARRRHLHRAGSGVEQRQHPGRAARSHRQVDDVLYGGVAGLDGGRHSAALPAVGSGPYAGADAQCGYLQGNHRAPRSRRPARQRERPHRGAGAGSGAAVRRRQHRFSRRPRGARQHGGGFVGAAPVPASFQAGS